MRERDLLTLGSITRFVFALAPSAFSFQLIFVFLMHIHFLFFCFIILYLFLPSTFLLFWSVFPSFFLLFHTFRFSSVYEKFYTKLFSSSFLLPPVRRCKDKILTIFTLDFVISPITSAQVVTGQDFRLKLLFYNIVFYSWLKISIIKSQCSLYY